MASTRPPSPQALSSRCTSPWWSVCAGIAGLVIGYSLMVGQTHIASAGGSQCRCANGQCAMQAS